MWFAIGGKTELCVTEDEADGKEQPYLNMTNPPQNTECALKHVLCKSRKQGDPPPTKTNSFQRAGEAEEGRGGILIPHIDL